MTSLDFSDQVGTLPAWRRYANSKRPLPTSAGGLEIGMLAGVMS
jgi:hypothetical protein